MKNEIIERNGFIFSIVLLLISFTIIFSNTYEFFGSLTAAVLTAVLGWISYVIVRLTWLSLK